jgi:hypothetical protein
MISDFRKEKVLRFEVFRSHSKHMQKDSMRVNKQVKFIDKPESLLGNVMLKNKRKELESHQQEKCILELSS